MARCAMVMAWSEPGYEKTSQIRRNKLRRGAQTYRAQDEIKLN